MPLYFVCPGEAEVTSTTIKCPVGISTVSAEPYESFKIEDAQVLLDGLFYGVGLILVFWLIKKALDI